MTCNYCKKKIKPGTETWYEDEKKHFVLCGACDRKLVDGELKWRAVAG